MSPSTSPHRTPIWENLKDKRRPVKFVNNIFEKLKTLGTFRKTFVTLSFVAFPTLIAIGFGVQAVDVVTEASAAIGFFSAAAVIATLFFWLCEEMLELSATRRIAALVIFGIVTVISLHYGVHWASEKADEVALVKMTNEAHTLINDVMTKRMFEELTRKQQKPVMHPGQTRNEPQKPAPKTNSFVFVVPGVWVNGNTWDFLVNHRGPDPSYHVQILFVDIIKQKQVIASKTSLSIADINSYQTILSYPEIDPKGRGSIFATQFLWTPPVANHEKYLIDATWRDGTVHQELEIERVNGRWFWATQIKDRESGNVLVSCKDHGFPGAELSDKPCFPAMTLSGD